MMFVVSPWAGVVVDDEVFGLLDVPVSVDPRLGSDGIDGVEPPPGSRPVRPSTTPPMRSPRLLPPSPPDPERSSGPSAAATPAVEIIPAATSPTSALATRRR